MALDNFDIVLGGGVIPLAAVPAATALQTPWFNMRDVVSVDLIIRLENGANEPVIQLQQATDNAGAGAVALPITEVSVAAAADLMAGHTYVNDANVHRSNEPLLVSYTPNAAAGTATAGNQAIVHVRVHQGVFTDGFTHFRLNSAAVAGRASVVVAIVKDKLRKGKTNPVLLN